MLPAASPMSGDALEAQRTRAGVVGGGSSNRIQVSFFYVNPAKVFVDAEVHAVQGSGALRSRHGYVTVRYLLLLS